MRRNQVLHAGRVRNDEAALGIGPEYERARLRFRGLGVGRWAAPKQAAEAKHKKKKAGHHWRQRAEPQK
ncbi:hypothetical protein GCM10023186_13440 [Hymenobacter koreensis]|uniref:Uncharacterized protein n=1 Tax=Hymenobacter koreensis TaxID=1084523 RepID=A0ABP8IX04_9BACT